MDVRPCSPADVDAVVALQQAWETHWFGAPENDRDEVLEDLDRREQSRLVWDGDELLAAAWWWGTHTVLMVRPGHEHLLDDLLAWLESGADSVEALDRDTHLREALQRRGWRHDHSGFELIRALDGWDLAQPVWPDGYALTGPDDPEALHALLYERTGWLDVPGHRFRPYDEWRSLMLTPTTVPEQQVVVTSEGRPVGMALCRLFSDGTGWIAQLAVEDAHKGRGLGRALLLEGLQRQVAAGATALGLGVSAENRDALRLYLSVGLTIDREWLNHVPPR